MNILIVIGIIIIFLIGFALGLALPYFLRKYISMESPNIQNYEPDAIQQYQIKIDEEMRMLRTEISSINNKLATTTTNNEQILNEWLNGGDNNES